MCPFYSTMSISTRLSLVLNYLFTAICSVHIVLIYLFTAICSVHIVTNHGSAEYLLWLFIKHEKQHNVEMARALCPGTSYHKQTVLPSHTCINSVPTQNNDMQLAQHANAHWASFSNAVKKNLRGISSELDLGQHLAFMKVFSSGICSELQKTFRTRNSSRNSARVFSNAIPLKTTRWPRGPSCGFLRNRISEKVSLTR